VGPTCQHLPRARDRASDAIAAGRHRPIVSPLTRSPARLAPCISVPLRQPSSLFLNTGLGHSLFPSPSSIEPALPHPSSAPVSPALPSPLNSSPIVVALELHHVLASTTHPPLSPIAPGSLTGDLPRRGCPPPRRGPAIPSALRPNWPYHCDSLPPLVP
jgi:hypothetical protein